MSKTCLDLKEAQPLLMMLFIFHTKTIFLSRFLIQVEKYQQIVMNIFQNINSCNYTLFDGPGIKLTDSVVKTTKQLLHQLFSV